MQGSHKRSGFGTMAPHKVNLEETVRSVILEAGSQGGVVNFASVLRAAKEADGASKISTKELEELVLRTAAYYRLPVAFDDP